MAVHVHANHHQSMCHMWKALAQPAQRMLRKDLIMLEHGVKVEEAWRCRRERLLVVHAS